MKLKALSIALVAALGMAAGCSTHTTVSQASRTTSVAEAEAQYAIGRYFQGQQRYELAIDSYRRALAANPAHAGAHNALGASLLLTGKNAEAVEQFKAGLKHQPRSAALWNNLGYAYALSGENMLAAMAYKQSLDLDPNDYKTNTNLAMVQQTQPEATPAPVVSVSAPVVAAPAPVIPVSAPVVAAPAAVVATPAALAATPEPAEAIAVKIAAEPVKTIEASQPQAAVSRAAVQPEPAAVALTPPVLAKAEAAPTPAIEATPPQPVAIQAVPAPVAPITQPAAELAGAGVATAATTVAVAEVAPRVFELNLAESIAPPATIVMAPAPATASNAKRISVPLREDVIQTASVNSDDFVLEVRNGNGVRRMAWRTSQYLAEHGYTTKRLTNQRGFNVKVTRIFYLPGYLAEAQKLMAHLPKDTVLTETSNMRRGIHVRVVLGKDMVQHQAGLDAAQANIKLAALQIGY